MLRRLLLAGTILAVPHLALADSNVPFVPASDPATNQLITQGSTTPTPQCTSFIAINQTASTAVITGTASQHLYICVIKLISATAQNVSVIEGTTTTTPCDTSATAIDGGTTPSNAVAANGGWSISAPTPWLKTKTAADNLCVMQSGAGNVSGVISYVSAP